jgi:hypothetical protein
MVATVARGVIMNRTFQRNPQVEGAPLSDEAILLNPTTSSFFMLNRTSSFIWDRLSKPTTAESLAAQICESFDNITPADALNDVKTTLDQMLSLELVITGDAPESNR